LNSLYKRKLCKTLKLTKPSKRSSLSENNTPNILFDKTRKSFKNLKSSSKLINSLLISLKGYNELLKILSIHHYYRFTEFGHNELQLLAEAFNSNAFLKELILDFYE